MAEKLFCNACGRELKRYGGDGSLLEDAFAAEKEWGYFSRKDRTRHSFVICEECYDGIISKFAIPPREENVTEL